MRKNRFIRTRGIRKKTPLIEIDITSLLDILVIMLVFLLKSYNSSGIIINVPPGVSLPRSVAKQPNSTGTIVQVSPERIWVDDKVVLDVNQLSAKTYDQQNRRIIPLYNELVKKREEINLVKNVSHNAKEFSGQINFIIDKTLKYNYIKKLMYTGAEAGFTRYKFVVLSDE